MKVAVEEMGACKRRLQVEEAPEVVPQAWEKAFTRVQREARLPGFRKGKVPRSMIKLHFSDDVKQEVARSLIPEVYRQALDETRLKPVEEPDLQEVTPRGERAPVVLGGGRDQARHRARRLHRPRRHPRAQAARRRGGGRGDQPRSASSTRSSARWSARPTSATSSSWTTRSPPRAWTRARRRTTASSSARAACCPRSRRR